MTASHDDGSGCFSHCISVRIFWLRKGRTYLVVDVICPCPPEEILERAVIGRELVLRKDIVRDHTGFAKFYLFVQGWLERVGVCLLVIMPLGR